MDDYVVGIDQHPIGRRQPFNSHVLPELLLNALGQFRSH